MFGFQVSYLLICTFVFRFVLLIIAILLFGFVLLIFAYLYIYIRSWSELSADPIETHWDHKSRFIYVIFWLLLYSHPCFHNYMFAWICFYIAYIFSNAFVVDPTCHIETHWAWEKHMSKSSTRRIEKNLSTAKCTIVSYKHLWTNSWSMKNIIIWGFCLDFPTSILLRQCKRIFTKPMLRL